MGLSGGRSAGSLRRHQSQTGFSPAERDQIRALGSLDRLDRRRLHHFRRPETHRSGVHDGQRNFGGRADRLLRLFRGDSPNRRFVAGIRPPFLLSLGLLDGAFYAARQPSPRPTELSRSAASSTARTLHRLQYLYPQLPDESRRQKYGTIGPNRSRRMHIVRNLRRRLPERGRRSSLRLQEERRAR